MLEQIIPHLPAILSALAGAGVFAGASKLWNRYMESEKQDADLARQFRNELKDELDSHRKRINRLEQKLDEEQTARVQAEQQNRVLQRKVDLLLKAVNDLRQEEGLGKVKEDEVIPSALSGNISNDS